MKSAFYLPIWPVAVGTLMVFAAGCGRDSVKVYHVDNQDAASPALPPVPAPTPGAMPATMPDGLSTPDNSGLPTLQYTLPTGWEQKPPTQMRVASFNISQNSKNADISVIPLAGMAGTDPANVNRWRGQVGLGQLPDAELAGMAEKIVVVGEPADLYDIAGATPGSGDAQRILAVIFHRAGVSWFFKMMGDADLVEQQKAAFVGFLKSVSFGPPSSGAPSPIDGDQLPAGHPPIGDVNGVVSPMNVDAAAKPGWTVPAGWQEGPPEQFLTAKFVIAGADGTEAAVNVSALAGDGGGLPANVNRWRHQIGLGPMTDADAANLPSLNVSGGRAAMVDMSGTDGRTGKVTRLIGVVLPHGDQTWFYKLMGDAEIVAQQEDAFIQFVQSAKYPDAH